MIPKIIHYVWLSNDPFPEKIQLCITSWKKYLPDYEIIQWNLENLPIKDELWIRQCCEKRKYAFATDYIRLYVLFYYGGIYLDSDVEVLKSYNDLLHLPYFFSKENSEYEIEPATIGAVQGLEWIEKCLEYYKNRDFILDNGSLDIKPLPKILTEILKSNYNIIELREIITYSPKGDNIYRFTNDYFSPFEWNGNGGEITGNTYSVHRFAASWITKRQKLKIYLRKLFSLTESSICIKIYKKIMS
ncbi:glycosyltransferase family 32 protein [Epilithonimonas hominis]|uniref:glycosyltransferase family 32 protein n=1 Tax=Epilithonimonas hominis TaxID=420404 RepID=UPI0028971848|nr:glycosyltransferase [Epilithonimonas hominis]